MPAKVMRPSLVARLPNDCTESSSRESWISAAVVMVARFEVSSTVCTRVRSSHPRIVGDMVAYDLVWDTRLAFASSSAHDQVATVVGIPVGAEDGVGLGSLREGDVRGGFVHHGETDEAIDGARLDGGEEASAKWPSMH